MAEAPHIDDVVETLVENGVSFVAVNKQSLVDDLSRIYYLQPIGVTEEEQKEITSLVTEEIGYRPQQGKAGSVRIGEKAAPVTIQNVLHGDLHLYRRVPLYVDGSLPGLEDTSAKEGLETVEDVLDEQPNLEPRPSETVQLEQLLRELAASGAASVELAHDPLVFGETCVSVRIPVVPANAAHIVRPVESVQVGQETYPFDATLTMDGSFGTGYNWTALYVSDDVRGLKPLSVEEGHRDGRTLIEKAKEVDSVRELLSVR
jgi:hypothetical protein